MRSEGAVEPDQLEAGQKQNEKRLQSSKKMRLNSFKESLLLLCAEQTTGLKFLFGFMTNEPHFRSPFSIKLITISQTYQTKGII